MSVHISFFFLSLLIVLVRGQIRVGDEKQQDDIRAASEQIKCDVCYTLMQDVLSKSLAKSGAKSETQIIDVINEICGDSSMMSPAFTRQYEVAKVGKKFVFQKAPPPDAAAPIFRMDWRTASMKKACDKALVEADSEIAEIVFRELTANPKKPDLEKLRKEGCKCQPSTEWLNANTKSTTNKKTKNSNSNKDLEKEKEKKEARKSDNAKANAKANAKSDIKEKAKANAKGKAKKEKEL
eukprot:c3805_g1_i1.p1 GENE.c3805_g1_i1~~c3805_g1_i1.p1  ORF type:complete len:258 (+),score=86.03 c3805_g1_i1:62-775(+)